MIGAAAPIVEYEQGMRVVDVMTTEVETVRPVWSFDDVPAGPTL